MRRLILIILAVALSVSLFTACSAPDVTLTEGEFVAQVYLTHGDRVGSVKILRNGRTIDKWKIDSSVNDSGASLEFVDLNFDGHPDLRLLAETGEHNRYSCRLYSPDAEMFYTNDKLNSLLDVTVDTAAKQLTAYYRTHTTEPATIDSPGEYIDEEGTEAYEWQNGKLCIVRRECVTYYSETDIYCVALWEIDAYGEFSPTRERWLTPDQYERAGYEPIS
ncbi:MAG: VCBS repeat-containing protein [Clostridia bacterium]|nr:VCBS repeat-containing protein [Clostridia bacterium]